MWHKRAIHCCAQGLHEAGIHAGWNGLSRFHNIWVLVWKDLKIGIPNLWELMWYEGVFTVGPSWGLGHLWWPLHVAWASSQSSMMESLKVIRWKRGVCDLGSHIATSPLYILLVKAITKFFLCSRREDACPPPLKGVSPWHCEMSIWNKKYHGSHLGKKSLLRWYISMNYVSKPFWTWFTYAPYRNAYHMLISPWVKLNLYSWLLNNVRVKSANPLHSWKSMYSIWLPQNLTTNNLRLMRNLINNIHN